MQVVGVVNVTADSFSDGGRYLDPDRAVAHGLALAAEGAAIVDVGGESTRPGAVRVDPRAEARGCCRWSKSLPRRALRSASTPCTPPWRGPRSRRRGDRQRRVRRRADPAMAPLVADARVPWVLMHWRRSIPTDPHRVPRYEDVVAEVRAELLAASTPRWRPASTRRS